MKKFLIIVAVFILAMIAFASIGPLVLMAFGAWLAYYSLKAFIKTDSILKKVLWALVGIAGVSIALHAFPAIIGLIAIVALFYIFKEWKKDKSQKQFVTASDSEYQDFYNFEREWDSIMNKYKN